MDAFNFKVYVYVFYFPHTYINIIWVLHKMGPKIRHFSCWLLLSLSLLLYIRCFVSPPPVSEVPSQGVLEVKEQKNIVDHMWIVTAHHHTSETSALFIA